MDPFLLEDKVQVDTSGKGFTGPFNRNGPTDVAVLHHYYTKSEEEWHNKGCVRKAANPKAINRCGVKSFVGDIYDDTAWSTLKTYVPSYATFD